MPATPDGSPSLTVLVVEDDPEMRALLRDFLEEAGHRVIVQAAGEEAVAAAELERIDAVILDKEIPGTSGLDLLSFFRHRLPGIPVILITAFGGPRVADEAVRRGAARYLEKPFRVGELLGTVRALTARGESGDPAAPPSR